MKVRLLTDITLPGIKKQIRKASKKKPGRALVSTSVVKIEGHYLAAIAYRRKRRK